MTQKFNYDDHPVDRIYVDWANTLDSTGKDSTEAASRLNIPEILAQVKGNMEYIIGVGDLTDNLKKFVFYGKALPDDPETLQMAQTSTLIPLNNVEAWNRIKDHNMIRMYHAMLGLLTETSEIFLAFYAFVFKSVPIDWANIAEESGDLCWYMALLAKAQGYTSFDEFMAGNKAKLTARYGDTWTQDGALNRDTVNEMNELETAAPIMVDAKEDGGHLGNYFRDDPGSFDWNDTTNTSPLKDILSLRDKITNDIGLVSQEPEIEAIDRAIEIMMLRRAKLQEQTTFPTPPPHNYPTVSNDRKAAILKKYPTLTSIVSQLSATMYVTQNRNHRLENNEAFIALQLKATAERFFNFETCTCVPPAEHDSLCPMFGVIK